MSETEEKKPSPEERALRILAMRQRAAEAERLVDTHLWVLDGAERDARCADIAAAAVAALPENASYRDVTATYYRALAEFRRDCVEVIRANIDEVRRDAIRARREAELAETRDLDPAALSVWGSLLGPMLP